MRAEHFALLGAKSGPIYTLYIIFSYKKRFGKKDIGLSYKICDFGLTAGIYCTIFNSIPIIGLSMVSDTAKICHLIYYSNYAIL